MKCSPHSHLIDLPSGRKIRTHTDCELGDDEELGKFSLKTLAKIAAPIAKIAGPAVGAVIGGPMGAQIGGALGSGIGGQLDAAGKTKKKKQLIDAGVSPEAANKIVESSAISASGLTGNDLQTIASSPSLKNELLAALREYNSQQLNNANSAKKISSNLDPKLNSILSLVKKGELQKQVTYEHNKKVKDSQRWKNSEAKQKRILDRLEALEKKLEGRNLYNKIAAASFGIPGHII